MDKLAIAHWLLANFKWIAGVIIAIVVTIVIINSIKGLLKLAVTFGALIIGLYIVHALLSSYTSPDAKYDIKDAGVTCLGNHCKMLVKVDADLDAKICGEELKIPMKKWSYRWLISKIKGETALSSIQLRELLSYDKETGGITNKTKLTLGYFFDNIGIKFSEDCIGTYCTGNNCNGKQGTLRVWVGSGSTAPLELKKNNFRSYVLNDGDSVRIRFE